MSVRMADATTDDNLISLQVAAAMCGVDYDTVLKWCRAGALQYVEVGPTCIKRVYRRDVKRLIVTPRPASR